MIQALAELNATHLEEEARLTGMVQRLERENKRLKRRLSALWRRQKRVAKRTG